MKNEFGYISKSTFDSCDINTYKVKAAAFDENESLKVKIMNHDAFDELNHYDRNNTGSINSTYYAIDSKGSPITLYNTQVVNSSFRAIPHALISCSMYMIGSPIEAQTTDRIKHFTDNTKVRKMLFYHDELIRVFGNEATSAKEKFSKCNKHKLIRVQCDAKPVKNRRLCELSMIDNSMKIDIVQSFDYNVSGYYELIKIAPKTYLSITFDKGVSVDEVHKIRKRLDSAIHLIAFCKTRNAVVRLKCYNNMTYTLNDLSSKNDLAKRSIHTLNNGKDISDNFIKLLKLLFNISNENRNAFFPFLQYDRVPASVEIRFLEYYRVLEFMDTLNQREKRMGKSNRFLLRIVKKYSNLKQRYFPNDCDDAVEEEIRSLRNYYSHNGYYIDTLPIPAHKPKCYKDVDVGWLLDVAAYIRLVAYLELYSLAGIAVDENEIMHCIR